MFCAPANATGFNTSFAVGAPPRLCCSTYPLLYFPCFSKLTLMHRMASTFTSSTRSEAWRIVVILALYTVCSTPLNRE